MNCRWPITDCRLPKPKGLTGIFSIAIRHSPFGNAFTLIELLVVISILGILAALAVPAIKNFGKSDTAITATQQMLRDVARARQLAIADHTTVYMVFVPTNFWNDSINGTWPNTWWNNLTPAQQTAVTNLCDKQLSGYTFVAYGALGDQPGRHQWHYLAPWQNLPEGEFISYWKFYQPATSPPFVFKDLIPPGNTFTIYQFNYTNNIPFPIDTVQTNPAAMSDLPSLPYIAFNYLGQLVSPASPYLDSDSLGSGIDIPLTRGNVMPAVNIANGKAFMLQAPQISETPPGNSTNISYNVIHVDALTGRATLEFHKVQ